jgi:hypothetical protein
VALEELIKQIIIIEIKGEYFNTIEEAINFRIIMPLMVVDIKRLLQLQNCYLRYLKLLHFIINFKFKVVKSFIKHFDNLKRQEHFNY